MNTPILEILRRRRSVNMSVPSALALVLVLLLAVAPLTAQGNPAQQEGRAIPSAPEQTLDPEVRQESHNACKEPYKLNTDED